MWGVDGAVEPRGSTRLSLGSPGRRCPSSEQNKDRESNEATFTEHLLGTGGPAKNPHRLFLFVSGQVTLVVVLLKVNT